MSGRSIDRSSFADRLNKRRVDRSLVRLYISRVSNTHIHKAPHITHTHTYTCVQHIYTRTHRSNTRGVTIFGGFCGNAEESLTLFEHETGGLYNGRTWKNISSVEGRSCDRLVAQVFIRFRVFAGPIFGETYRWTALAARLLYRGKI